MDRVDVPFMDVMMSLGLAPPLSAFPAGVTCYVGGKARTEKSQYTNRNPFFSENIHPFIYKSVCASNSNTQVFFDTERVEGRHG